MKKIKIERKIVYQDQKIEVSTEDDGTINLKFKQPHNIQINPHDHMSLDSEIIRLLKIKAENGGKFVTQEEVGKAMGISRQMINRRWRVFQDTDLLTLLKGEYEKSKITPQLLNRLTELIVMNPFFSAYDLKTILIEEGYCDEISEAALYQAQRHMDGRKIVELLRAKGDSKNPDIQMTSGYMFEKLFRIIDSLIEKIPQGTTSPIMTEQKLYNHLKKHIQEKVKRTGIFQKREHLQRDIKRNIGFLKRLMKSLSSSRVCPDCNREIIKYHSKRERFYLDKNGKKVSDECKVYRWGNPNCQTKFFTVPPKGVESYARVHKDVKKMAFRWLFHMRGSLSRVKDELIENRIDVSITTVLRWIKKAGEQCPDILDIENQEFWEQPLIIDEKWIKILDKWNYIFTAVGSVFSDLIAADLFKSKGKTPMTIFLLSLKARGFNPWCIVTDLLMGYQTVVKEVFPDCQYHQCVLHAERDAKRIVRKALPGGVDDKLRKKLIGKIRKLFSSKNSKQLNKRYKKILRLKPRVSNEVEKVFSMLNKYYPKLESSIMNKNIPKTTNAVERAIGEFEERYQLTKGFTSFYSARCFVKAFQAYYRFRKISFGINKGKSRLQLKGNPLANLKFTDFLLPTQA